MMLWSSNCTSCEARVKHEMYMRIRGRVHIYQRISDQPAYLYLNGLIRLYCGLYSTYLTEVLIVARKDDLTTYQSINSTQPINHFESR